MSEEVRTRYQLWKDVYGTPIDKAAELAGTWDMPNSKPSVKPGKEKAVIEKTASALDEATQILKTAFDANLEVNIKETPKSSPGKNPQTSLQPHVDVTGKEPPKPVLLKKAERYALPLDERYPLDDYGQVKAASVYFDENYGEMPIEVRRVYCQNMVRRAEELGIETSSMAQKYASSRYAEPYEIRAAIDARRLLVEEEHQDVLSKVAECRSRLLPEDFASLLFQFDKLANVDRLYGVEIPDPYLSTMSKTAAQESQTDPEKSILIGNDYITVRNLITFAKMRQSAVLSRFGKEFAKEFTKDPEGIFNSLPRDQKIILIRMANNNASAREGASTS